MSRKLYGYITNDEKPELTQNWDEKGKVYYTDSDGNQVDFNVNPFVKLANKVKAGVSNFGDWINESNPNSEAYKQKVGLTAVLGTAPFGIGELATVGVTRALAPYFGRKIAQNMATGFGSGVVGGGVGGGLEAGLNNENIFAGGLKGSLLGGLGGLLGGYGLGKVAQKLNTQTAWHGSPYKFDRFSNEAIGTGEGAQAHGYGHYAAKNKDTAQAYAKNLSEGNKIIEYKGVPYKSVDEFKPNEYNYKLLADVKNDGLEVTRQGLQKERQWALGKLEKTQDKGWWQDYLQEIDKKENLLNDLNPDLLSDIRPDTGNLYKLSIPKDDVMLREGLPFGEQPKAVQENLKNIFNNEYNFKNINNLQNDLKEITQRIEQAKNQNNKKLVNFLIYKKDLLLEEINKLNHLNNEINNSRYIYNILSETKPQEEVSQILSNNGIKGISYNGGIDGEARVIFNPDDIDIIPYYDNPTSFKERFINLLSRD